MSDPRVSVRFDGNSRVYHPGDTLAGEYRLESIPLDDVKALEVSVLWYTEGKGDEDLVVHDFHRMSVEGNAPLDLHRPQRFSTVLPNSPLSYRGAILKLHWCVRVRVFLGRGRDVVGQREFRLGDVPAVKMKSPPAGKGDADANPLANGGRARDLGAASAARLGGDAAAIKVASA